MYHLKACIHFVTSTNRWLKVSNISTYTSHFSGKNLTLLQSSTLKVKALLLQLYIIHQLHFFYVGHNTHIYYTLYLSRQPHLSITRKQSSRNFNYFPRLDWPVTSITSLSPQQLAITKALWEENKEEVAKLTGPAIPLQLFLKKITHWTAKIQIHLLKWNILELCTAYLFYMATMGA